MKCHINIMSILYILSFIILGCFLSGCVKSKDISDVGMFENTITPNSINQLVIAHIPDNCYFSNISPDLQWLLFTCGSNELNALKIGASQPVPLTGIALINKPNIEARVITAFSPDGKKLAVAVSGGSLMIYDVGIWESPKTLYSGLQNLSTPIWSTDNQTIAVTYMQPGQALSIIKLDGTFKNILTYQEIHKEIGDVANIFGPTWSPDGKKLAYLETFSLINPSPVQLWTYNIDTGEKDRLYSGKSGEIGFYPIWSSDGNKIAMEDYSSVNLNIYDINNNAFYTLKQYPKEFGEFSFNWAPNGNLLAVDDGGGGISILEIKNRNSYQVSPKCHALIRWSNDNSLLCESALGDISLLKLPK